MMDRVIAHANMPDLTCLNEPIHRCEYFFKGPFSISPMNQIKIQIGGIKFRNSKIASSLNRSIHILIFNLIKSNFGSDKQLLPFKTFYSFSDCMVIAIHVGCINMAVPNIESLFDNLGTLVPKQLI